MKWHTLLFLGTILASASANAATSTPSKIGGNGPIDRPTNHTGAWCFSTWTFCPTLPDTFVADGDSATVVFRARNWKAGQPAVPLNFHLDHVAVLERSIYEANVASLASLYPDPYAAALPTTGQDALDVVPLVATGLTYYTNFDGGIGPEWSYDPAQVTYDATSGEQMFDDPFHPEVINGDWVSVTGSMAIGSGSGPEFVEATLQLSGLTPGHEYVICYWSRSLFGGVGFTCAPGETYDDYEVAVYGETLICLPDLPALGVASIRTTGWDPLRRLWRFQTEIENSGVGPATGITVVLAELPSTVVVVDGDAPVPPLGNTARDSRSWANDSFVLDLGNHLDDVIVAGIEYHFQDDCGQPATSTSVKLLASPESYPTAAPGLSQALRLSRATPNPFHPRTVMSLRLDIAQVVELTVVDVRGRHVRTLHHGPLPVGPHEVSWDGRDQYGRAVAAGVYLVHARTRSEVVSQRLVLLK